MKEYTAIEVDSFAAVKLLRMAEPPYRELELDVMKDYCFIILDFPTDGNATVVEPQHLKAMGIVKLVAAQPLKVWTACTE